MSQTAKMDRDGLVPRLLASVPIWFWRSFSKISLILPYYHIVTDEDVPHVKHLYVFRGVRQFCKDLDFFLANYTPIGLQEVIEHVKAEKPFPRKCFHLTFDDGFREMHDVVVPILKARGVPATFFLNSGFIDNLDMAIQNKACVLIDFLFKNSTDSGLRKASDILDFYSVPSGDLSRRILSINYQERSIVSEIAVAYGCDLPGYISSARPYMSSEQIQSILKQGFTIGAHSVDHPLYAELSFAEQISQTEDSLHFIQERFQINYGAFAFPHSDTGVKAEFYERLWNGRKLDISFGTGGMTKHFFSRNLQRFAMEKTFLSARQVVGKHYPRAIYRNLVHPRLAAQ